MSIKMIFVKQGPTINGVLNRVVNELKQILKKDFNKKMVENTAFKLFDVWWDERKKNEKGLPVGVGSTSISNNVAPSVAPSVEVVPASVASISISPAVVKEEPKNQGLASLLEQATTPLGLNYDGFGLGIRASMPKMPSFRVSCNQGRECPWLCSLHRVTRAIIVD
jgi:histone-lysine N-methyltransferase SETD1